MTEAYICLGKIGDILSLLPLLSHKAEKQKSPVNLVISKEYQDVVAGLDYIKPDVLDVHWQDLESAIRYAKKKYDKVLTAQTYGKTIAIQHRYPSFQHDQWARCNSLHLFGNLPLRLPRPSNAAELITHYLAGKRTILFADKGESSPFEHADRFSERLHESFGDTHNIVRLSTIRLERFRDFLALYDAAEVLIVTETAHLHLSKATKTPTFALVTDKPQRWHGSAWAKNFLLHIRYSQYLRREKELLKGIKSVLA